jgi:hypothetical protein
MEKMKKNIKGSTLLLAMVIISTVLFAGIGAATILSRQIKEIPSIRNETVAFYISETLVDMIREKNMTTEDVNCENLNFGNIEMECFVEEVNEKYYIVVKVGNDYYSFSKNINESGQNNGGGNGVVKVYYQTSSWENWNPPYIVWQNHLGEWGPSGSTGVTMDHSTDYQGWHVFESLDVEENDYMRVSFRNSGSGRDWGSCDDWWHCIDKNETVVNVRQNVGSKVDKIDSGYPITIYYNTKGEWIVPYIAYQLSDGTTVRSAPGIQMYDVSEEYGQFWYVIHISAEKSAGIKAYFTNGGTGRDYGGDSSYLGRLYEISRESIVNIEKHSGIINNGPPN